MKAQWDLSCVRQWMLSNRVKIAVGLFGALFFGVLTISVASAQLTTADVLGTITDSTGAVVPGATVTIKNLGTGVSATTKSKVPPPAMLT